MDDHFMKITIFKFRSDKVGIIIYNVYDYKYVLKRSGRISSGDQLMPLYVLDTMGSVPGLIGLFVAGIFSSALSSVSPILNSLAAITMEDYIKVKTYHSILFLYFNLKEYDST